MNILVVEDDRDIQFAVKIILETEGYSVAFACDGREALERLQQQGLPDLILLDMVMPVMDGWQFAAEFHKRYDHEIPILVMTAASDAAKRASDIYAEGYVSKPFTIDLFLRTVNDHARPRAIKKIA